jgi:PIN domain nuclease of toxin-antitoxin system
LTAKALLDTHVVIWWLAAPERLSERASECISSATVKLVNTISFWEVATLARRGRIRLDRDPVRWTVELLGQPGVELAALTPTAAAEAGRLAGFHGDPADRILYATAKELQVPLVTRDALLRSYAEEHGDVETVW